jgi:hypothetical protein
VVKVREGLVMDKGQGLRLGLEDKG